MDRTPKEAVLVLGASILCHVILRQEQGLLPFAFPSSTKNVAWSPKTTPVLPLLTSERWPRACSLEQTYRQTELGQGCPLFYTIGRWAVGSRPSESGLKGTNGKAVGDDDPVPVPHSLSSAMLAPPNRAVAPVTRLEFLGVSSR